MDETLCTLALSLIPGLGPLGFKKIMALASSAARAFSLSPQELKGLGFRSSVIKALKDPEKLLLRAQREMEALERLGARVIALGQREYPTLLREIPDPPPVLFVQGRWSLGPYPLAIVGARAASSYGLKIAKQWSRELAQAGLDIVSGLALGIDAASHWGALEGGGYTLAVLGCGLDQRYPAENQTLREKILQNGGAIVTEFPLGTEPKPGHFPARNRIISGVSRGVLVVEASPRSGSLITARLAADQGREVMAVPGNIYSRRSHGCHRLIREGALLVDQPAQVLEALGLELRPEEKESVNSLTLEPLEAKVLGHLEVYPIHVDDLAVKTGLEVSALSGILLALELKGLVESLAGNFYQKVSEDEKRVDHR